MGVLQRFSRGLIGRQPAPEGSGLAGVPQNLGLALRARLERRVRGAGDAIRGAWKDAREAREAREGQGTQAQETSEPVSRTHEGN